MDERTAGRTEAIWWLREYIDRRYPAIGEHLWKQTEFIQKLKEWGIDGYKNRMVR